MRFPNAAKGINKIFASEILSLIATIASGIAAILTILFVDSGSTGNSAGAIASELSILIFGIAGLMLMFIAFIFQLIGVIQADQNIRISTNLGVPIVIKDGTYIEEAFKNIASRI